MASESVPSSASAAPPPAKPLPAPGSLGAWILAARPRTLVAGWAPVLVGGTLAIDRIESTPSSLSAPVFTSLWVAALIVAQSIQVGTNFINDAADHRRGADVAGRLGPPRAVSEGLLPGRSVMAAGVGLLGFAGVLGVVLSFVSSWWLLVPGGIALLAGFAYTAGPRPLAYLGLGEVFVFLFFGVFALGGTYAVLTLPAFPGGVSLGELWLGAFQEWASIWTTFGLLAVAILEINNIRDRATDAKVGKATLAVRIGDRWARRLFIGAVACGVATFAWTIRLGLFGPSLPAAIGTGVALVVAIILAAGSIQAVARGAEGRALNPVLGSVARLEGSMAAGLFVLVMLIPEI